MRYQATRYDLDFKFDAGTSRGVLRSKASWFIQIEEDGKKGIGECGILKGLSIEDFSSFDQNIREFLDESPDLNQIKDSDELGKLPSLRFALEMAALDLRGRNNGILYNNEFTSGKASIPINGLVWMGEYQFMYDQIKKKIDDGYTCIKLKIGAIDFEKEISLLKYIRGQFGAQDIEIRVDANGAFTPENALEKLKTLSDYSIHSIEQPIKQGQWDEMARLCSQSPLAIALDEELIGIKSLDVKRKCLDTIQPQYIIFKPSLIGGYQSCEEWIELADERSIGYWITSALESNIGLNAIAQWTFEKGIDMPQGLGTGQLYHNNFEGPLYIENGALHFRPDIPVYQNFDLF